jgi:Flp pilus assembly protein TadG
MSFEDKKKPLHAANISEDAVPKRFASRIQRMRGRSRSGSALVEFALIAPVLFLLLFGIIETGVIYFANSALENAIDDAAREVRTGQVSGPVTPGQLKALVCNDMTGLFSSSTCTSNLQVDMRAFPNFSSASYPNVINKDGSINTGSLQVQPAAACYVVLFRAFYPWTIMTPLMSPLLSNMPGGKYLLASAAAFRTEPYSAADSC